MRDLLDRMVISVQAEPGREEPGEVEVQILLRSGVGDGGRFLRYTARVMSFVQPFCWWDKNGGKVEWSERRRQEFAVREMYGMLGHGGAESGKCISRKKSSSGQDDARSNFMPAVRSYSGRVPYAWRLCKAHCSPQKPRCTATNLYPAHALHQRSRTFSSQRSWPA